jgi:hypothetical protein
MDSIEKVARRREARRRMRAHQRRSGQLRGRVVAASLLCFTLLWGVVFVQMATGNDPVLGRGTSGGATASKRSPPPEPPETEIGTEPEPAPEAEYVELEPAPEPEYVEPEYVEPEPVITSQS